MFKKIAIIALLFVLILPTFSTLLRSGYFPMHDDMQAMRLLQMDKCVKDGQIPCRWVPDMGYGYGYPQFNYYSPLPYYVMEGFHLSGLGFLDSVKAGFVVSVLLSAVGMYLLGNSLWGRAGGIISALFYSFSSYRAVDMYVRGAVGEFWALAFLPFILWSIKKEFEGNKKAPMWMALSIAGLFTSHNITTLMFIPVIALWVLFLSYSASGSPISVFKAKLKPLILSSFWGFCLSAFFLLPAWFEKNLVHVETLLQGYFNYLAHFVSIKQLLFSSFWGYGGSELGSYDNMSFSVGLVYWLLPILTFVPLLILKRKKEILLVTFFIVVGWFALFMTHSRSTFIWSRLEILKYLQFPWRFLSIVVFSFSVAAGAWSTLLKNRKSKIIGISFVYFVLFIFQRNFFLPVNWIKIDDETKFSGELWEKQLTISIFDYLPIYAQAPPANKAPDEPQFVDGEGQITSGEKGTNWQNWEVEVVEDGKLQLPLYYFPNWKVWVDKNEKDIFHDNDLGLITFDISKGTHRVYAKLEDTPVRKIGNGLTLIGLMVIPIYKLKTKKKR